MDCTVPVKRIAGWSVQEARTGAVRRGDKSSLPTSSSTAFILLTATIRINSSATVNDAKTGKIIAYSHRTTNVSCLSSLARPLKIRSSLPMREKKLFSQRDDWNCWILKQFERTRYFLGIHAWVLRQNEKQKNYAQKSVQKAHLPFSFFLFFIISQNACLNFLLMLPET